jgi:hypothetical protein
MSSSSPSQDVSLAVLFQVKRDVDTVASSPPNQLLFSHLFYLSIELNN